MLPSRWGSFRSGAALARRKGAELLEGLRPCFARTEPWLQAGKYAAAVMSDLRRRNGRRIAERSGDRTPDRTQRLLNRAVWDTFAAMGVVRRFAVAGLDEAARRTGRPRGLAVGAIDETGQVKAGTRTAGVKRQYLGCVGKVANGNGTVHLSYVREGTGHALIGARQWIPAGHIGDPVTSAVMGLPADLAFRTKGQLAIDILTEAFADGIRLDFVCGDEVYGSCTELRAFCEERDQAYVLRVPSSFRLTVASGFTLTCKQATARLGRRRGWEVRSAGTGSKGQRWYAWAWLATASPRHHLLIRRHLTTGEFAFCYCYLPEGQPASPSRLPDEVVVYGDCAINPRPDAEDLADIAIQSAASARALGIEPRVAMISFSTGTSGTGSDVDKVAEATRIVREREPDLAVDGPLQYAAATITSVGHSKRPGSPVAGRATVFVFPDLDTGNTTYKAVQRSAYVVSVGPMLQGLAKPVNDLSRGALVDDIVYTLALTAIQSCA